MSAEYKVYIPPEFEEGFKEFVDKIDGSKIVNLEDSKVDIEQLGAKVRTCLGQIPRDTDPGDLIYYRDIRSRNKPAEGTPLPWFRMMMDLKASEKGLVTRAFDVITQANYSLEEAKNVDWEFDLPHFPRRYVRFGERTRALLTAIFSS